MGGGGGEEGIMKLLQEEKLGKHQVPNISNLSYKFITLLHEE